MPDIRTQDPGADRTDQRLTDLEIKLSFTEDAVDRLNDVVVRQQAQLEALVREVLALRQQAGGDDTATAGPRSLRDDLPPHY
jgi:SlyX protein